MNKEINLEALRKYAQSKFNCHQIPIEIREIQKFLTAEERQKIRGDENLANLLFNINFIPIKETDYYYWDNTTLSIWEYLGEVIKTLPLSSRILEIGCGPYATLSIALKKKYPHLYVKATDIEQDRVNTAIKMIAFNKMQIDVQQKDLLDDCDNNLDLIFMNPPYLSTQQQTIVSGSNSNINHEWQSGHGGVNGDDIVKRLLNDFGQKEWKNDITLLLGINNYFIKDETISFFVEQHSLKILDRFKPTEQCTPTGIYPQVYKIKRIFKNE